MNRGFSTKNMLILYDNTAAIGLEYITNTSTFQYIIGSTCLIAILMLLNSDNNDTMTTYQNLIKSAYLGQI